MKRVSLAAAVAVITSISAGGVYAELAEPCSNTSHAKWDRYGGNEHSTRHQTDTSIDSTNAASLEKAWHVLSSSIGGGSFMSTPVIYDGCVFAATDSGRMGVWDLTDGSLVWSRHVSDGQGVGGNFGWMVGAPAIDDTTIYAPLSERGNPRLVGLDRATGATLWDTPLLPDGHNQPAAYLNSGAVLAGDVVFMGISGPESQKTYARGAYAIVDKHTGEPLAKRWVINDRDYEFGYRGASIWATAAYDADSGYVYVGTGNPASTNLEHPLTNAIVKIDVRPDRDSFGDIVAAYKGDVDQYVPGLDQQPVCDEFGDRDGTPWTYGSGVWSTACVQLDLDFGASPNLWHSPSGHLMVGALQKSGVYHAVWAEHMQGAWKQPLGVPCFVCNNSTSAVDNEGTFALGVPGTLVSNQRHDGRLRWATVVGDAAPIQSVSVANDVVVLTNAAGQLVGINAETGTPVFVRRIASDTGGSCTNILTSSGVAIAGDHLVAAACTGGGSTLLALRAPTS